MPGRDPADRTGPRGPGRAAPLLAAGAVLLAAAACAGPERSQPPLAEDVYVDVMARLSAVRSATLPERTSSPLSAARADSLRDAVLREHGVGRPELRRFARRVGDEPDRMQAIWERIAARADSLRDAGWPPGTEPDTARREER